MRLPVHSEAGYALKTLLMLTQESCTGFNRFATVTAVLNRRFRVAIMPHSAAVRLVRCQALRHSQNILPVMVKKNFSMPDSSF
jgi:hypothetical protein